MIQQIYGITLRIKEYQGKRVVTLADIDAVHERPAGTASRNFKKHRNHFIEGEDFYKVKCSEVSTFFEQPLKNEVRTQNVQTLPNGFNPKADIILITETGYLMLVKSFRDDLAWSVQRQLVSTYFQVKQMLDCESCHLKRLNTKLNVFMHEEFGEIRTIEIDGQIYFVGVDVARALEYKHPRSAVSKRVKPNHKKIVPVNRFQNGNGSPTPTTVIDESGLYSLVLASKCKGAEPFQEWVTSEVIPTIRKTGAYNPNPPQIETTQPIQQIEIKQEIHIEHVENLNISQKKEVFSMKNSNNQGVKRIHPYTDENGRVLAEKHIIKMPDG
ncbi:MAG: ORF6N domain-containing protein, partial [Oscillospiraceae bacterium]|nr:ORF6N domain-containing protein [Oscillospiraceae bacterium]